MTRVATIMDPEFNSWKYPTNMPARKQRKDSNEKIRHPLLKKREAAKKAMEQERRIKKAGMALSLYRDGSLKIH